MSIELQKVKKIINILENITNNTLLIFTDLYNDQYCDNFLYQININGKYIFDFLLEQLNTLKIFDNSILDFENHHLHIYISSLKYGKYQKYNFKDEIMNIDLYKKTYKLCNDSIKEYTDIMEKEYNLEICELPDPWRRYESFNFKNRLKMHFLN